MSRWRGLSRNRRALYITVAIFVVAATAWASARLIADQDPGEPAPASLTVGDANALKAPLPPPVEVLVRKRSNTDGLGNVFVLAQLRPEDLAVKQADGTRDFVTIGNPDNQVILRDDGRGGDGVAGDGLFTGIASVNEKDLIDKQSEEQGEIGQRSGQQVPVFEGRSVSRVETPQAFDYAGFEAGATVTLKPAVAFVDPENAVTPSPAPGALISSKSAKITSATPVVPGTNQFQERVLMIRSAAVVQDPTRTWNPCTNAGDPDGVWTFNHVMTEMANQDASGIDPGDLVERWLNHWDTLQTINADTVAARTEMDDTILGQWPRLPNGKLDLAQSPLRLLAIVPRIDLRTTTGGGGSYAVNTSGNFLDAGEARFVFGFVLPDGWKTGGLIALPPIPGTNCRPLLFTVIVEFRVPKCECEEVRAWARQWVALKDFVPGGTDGQYNSRLERLTEQFVRANANPARPNGSALGQLRTNEVSLNPPPMPDGTVPWELREFQLTQFPFTFLNETTVGDTPNDAHNNTQLLKNWILTIRQQLPLNNLEAPIRPVPLLFGNSQEFLGANSQVNPEPDPNKIKFFWNAPNLTLTDTRTNWARHRVSRAACSGCHRREVFTPFLHVSSGTPNPPADISVFLSGINDLGDPADALANNLPVENPANGNPKRDFDDLARRELDIKKVARMKCFHFRAINAAAVHDSLVKTGRLPDDLFAGASEHGHASIAPEDMTQNHISEVH